MALLPDVDLAKNPDIAEVFARVEKSRGWVSNLMRSIAHSPEALKHYSALGHYGRYGTDLTEVQRELVIVATVRGVPYGWAHHSNLSRQIGISDAQLDQIKQGKTPGDFAPAERALCDYVFAYTACKGIDKKTHDAMLQHFSPRQIIDVSLLSAYYMAAGSLIIGLGVETETPEQLKVELEWQKKTMADAT
jgi:4-carboxymuconolactone decarboxylase